MTAKVMKVHRLFGERSIQAWRAAVVSWIALIFFSSTSIADEWGESFFAHLFNHGHKLNGHYDVLHFLAHKSVHVTLFCVLAILLWHALAKRRRKVVEILLWGAVIGSCSEFLQSFFPGRDPALRDVLINIGGTALGIAICTLSKGFAARPTWRPDIRPGG